MIDRLHPAEGEDCLEKANFASGAHHMKRSHPILSNSSLAKKSDVRGKESSMSNRGFDEYGQPKFEPGELPDYWDHFVYRGGELLWATAGKNRRKGQVAGSKRSDGYSEVFFAGHRERVHRVIWQMYFGKIPIGYVIDHINRDPSDNRLENLRCIPKRINHHNMKPLGAHFFKRTGKWTASIRRFGKTLSLGYHDTQEEAIAAYDKARQRLDRFDEYTFFGENNGPVRPTPNPPAGERMQ